MPRHALAAFLFAAAMAVSPAALAQASDAQRYAACMDLVRRDPMLAWEEALSWQGLGGGDPAGHCAAMALLGLGHLEEGAMRLEALAQDSHQPPPLRAGMLAQAGQAWLLAKQPRQALHDQTQALALAPDDVDLLLDRAATLAELNDLAAAGADLDRALQLAPKRPDALAMRAAAHRLRGDPAAARRDVTAALTVDPAHPDALLESGILHREAGETDQARQAWLTLLRAAPETAAAAAARRNIEKLDLPGAPQ